MHVVTFEQFVPGNKNDIWDFFSSPENLSRITPEEMQFKILGTKPEKMYQGQIIRYLVRPMFGIPLNWVTEITHVEEGKFFVDEQRFGPYSFWHHQHHFVPVEGGVLMKDILHYKVPFGFLGKLINEVLIKNKVKNIFNFRKLAVERVFV